VNLVDPKNFAAFRDTLLKMYPEGSGKRGTLSTTRILVEAGISEISLFLERKGSTLRLALETDPRQPDGCNIAGLIIFDTATNATTTVPLAVSPSLVRFRNNPIFLGHSEGVVVLADAILDEAKNVVATAAARSK